MGIQCSSTVANIKRFQSIWFIHTGLHHYPSHLHNLPTTFTHLYSNHSTSVYLCLQPFYHPAQTSSQSSTSLHISNSLFWPNFMLHWEVGGDWSLPILTIILFFLLHFTNRRLLVQPFLSDMQVLNMRYGFVKEIRVKYGQHSAKIVKLYSEVFR